MTDQDSARARAQRMWDADAASRGLGMSLDHVAPGAAVLSMTVAPAMLNGHGTCHGGFIFTLADSAFAFACNAHGPPTVAQMASVSFLAPAREGDRLTARAREVHRRGRGGIYDVTVQNGAGETIAEFRGHSRIVGRDPAPVQG